VEFEDCHDPSVADIDVRLATRLVNDNAATTYVPMEPAYVVPGDSVARSEPAAYVGDRAVTAYAGPETSITMSLDLTKLRTPTTVPRFAGRSSRGRSRATCSTSARGEWSGAGRSLRYDGRMSEYTERLQDLSRRLSSAKEYL